MILRDILITLETNKEEIIGEKKEIVASMFDINENIQTIFKNNEYLIQTLQYINTYFNYFLTEIDFEHQAYESMITYFKNLETITDTDLITIQNITEIMNIFESAFEYRIKPFILFENHCWTLIQKRILTNTNYHYQNHINLFDEETKDYIRTRLPKKGGSHANQDSK